jgi:hypothetical protein
MFNEDEMLRYVTLRSLWAIVLLYYTFIEHLRLDSDAQRDEQSTKSKV